MLAARCARVALRLRGVPSSSQLSIAFPSNTTSTRPVSSSCQSAATAHPGTISMTVSAAASPNVAVVSGLQPQSLWKFFAELSAIPRPSKHEQRVVEWLIAFAKERGLEYRQDSVGNLVICRPGTGGGEAAPPVVIQGHIDMVCEKNKDVDHDFMKDPIRLRLEGDWLMATGTTLGSDNGIGVCAGLALLDMPSSAKLPPLEVLFTVDEETGLTGAFGISPDLLKGRTMLNLDTEDWGELFIGCAGGGDSHIHLDIPIVPAATATGTVMELRIGGLLGGHSGLNIAEGRGNAVQLLARVVRSLMCTVPGLCVSSVSGGDKRNAIARESAALLVVPTGHEDKVQQLVAELQSHIKEEYGSLEKDLFVTVAKDSSSPTPPSHVLSAEGVAKLLSLICILPHGPVKMSHDVEGLVETSNNVASVHLIPAAGHGQHQHGTTTTTSASSVEAHIVTSTRSSLGPALEAVRDTIEQAVTLAGGRISRERAYPGWKPDVSSSVLQVVKDCYKDMTGAEATVGAIHAGLECGLLGAVFPGMDTVSYGPTIKGAHSPDERCLVPTVAPFWELTLKVLDKLADRRP